MCGITDSEVAASGALQVHFVNHAVQVWPGDQIKFQVVWTDDQVSASGGSVVRGPLGKAWIKTSASLAHKKKKVPSESGGPSADWPKECFCCGKITSTWTSMMHVHTQAEAPFSPAAGFLDAAWRLFQEGRESEANDMLVQASAYPQSRHEAHALAAHALAIDGRLADAVMHAEAAADIGRGEESRDGVIQALLEAGASAMSSTDPNDRLNGLQILEAAGKLNASHPLLKACSRLVLALTILRLPRALVADMAVKDKKREKLEHAGDDDVIDHNNTHQLRSEQLLREVLEVLPSSDMELQLDSFKKTRDTIEAAALTNLAILHVVKGERSEEVLRMVSYVLGLAGFVASKRAAGHLLAELVPGQLLPNEQDIDEQALSYALKLLHNFAWRRAVRSAVDSAIARVRERRRTAGITVVEASNGLGLLALEAVRAGANSVLVCSGISPLLARGLVATNTCRNGVRCSGEFEGFRRGGDDARSGEARNVDLYLDDAGCQQDCVALLSDVGLIKVESERVCRGILQMEVELGSDDYKLSSIPSGMGTSHSIQWGRPCSSGGGDVLVLNLSGMSSERLMHPWTIAAAARQVKSLARTHWVRKSLSTINKEMCDVDEEGCEEETCAILVPEAVQLYVQLVHSPVALTYTEVPKTVLGVNLSLWGAVVPQTLQMEGTALQVPTISLSPRVRALVWDFRQPNQLERIIEIGQQVDVPVTVADNGDVHAVLVSHDLVFGSVSPFPGDTKIDSLGSTGRERPIYLLPLPRPAARGEILTIRVDVLAGASGMAVKIL